MLRCHGWRVAVAPDSSRLLLASSSRMHCAVATSSRLAKRARESRAISSVHLRGLHVCVCACHPGMNMQECRRKVGVAGAHGSSVHRLSSPGGNARVAAPIKVVGPMRAPDAHIGGRIAMMCCTEGASSHLMRVVRNDCDCMSVLSNKRPSAPSAMAIPTWYAGCGILPPVVDRLHLAHGESSIPVSWQHAWLRRRSMEGSCRRRLTV